jgi:alpha-1,3-rhamnosyl/mannosyltransferase
LYEGFGLPPLEAMACGAPVACSNASSLPEVVADAGLLFDPLRAEDIAAAVQRVLSDAGLQRAMSALSLARASRFTWEDAARATMQIYHDAAAQDKQA